MGAEEIHRGNEQSLRVISPQLYRFFTGELERQYNIHPYDIQITASKVESGYNLTFYYGEGYGHRETHFFSSDAIQSLNSEIADFIEEFGESCKQAMIADYYKMLKM